ncbi:MAG: hypothetical protein COZ06_15530 [Armatimonadetes bacterium CG_4_10_14_3_um_filter_66_18]|nr:UPF0104 family protein [Armatimonadota bacterium]OIP07267.1 MAG: hypothetical protein AUJ96_07855 [Armatimonadetes bacterium CG2_30_66_41]PIU91295.1 MAG: hypothetical protein COS65_22445 [Armatimonadetes bacterium CG06_land_8_20_14_3_00_66_21]PIX49910.1 MAG: hypothetical protein COZ57_01625 [Armatimonadetes bacterium CG_4_8_14_3_um_filter_66_20]PIY48871.1 MAG: hypothetical protein COZ06_15530 [Armatimonadetes bacterium CG_4_10_14_3_um_filter_66_18]PIZ32473.1 MAG: hypothetical protein COY42_
MGDPGRRGHLARWRPLLTALVLSAAFAYLGVALASDWHSLRQHRWSIHWGRWALSLVLAGGWFALRGLLWQSLLRSFGHPLHFREAFRMWALSELGRYLPGSVWYALGRGHLAAEKGIGAAVTFTCMALELSLVLLGAALISIAGFGAASDSGRPLLVAAPVLLVLALALVQPRVLRAVFRSTGRTVPERLPGVRKLLGTLLLSGVLWLVMGLSFAVFASSLVPLPWSRWPAAGSAYAASWAIGFLAIVSPGGLGVRESVLTALLRPLMPAGSAVVVALGSRVWITVAEALGALLALWIGRTSARETESKT